MPLFECSQCGVIENTAVTTESWSNQAEGKPMRCSQCADGKWHGLFPRRMFAGSEYIKKGWRLQRPNPPGCICEYEHKSNAKCTYSAAGEGV